MRLDSYDLRILGISEKEGKILGVLQGLSHASTTEIGRSSNIPRTTVSFILDKLAKRSLAERILVQNHEEWRVAPNDELAKNIHKLASIFGGKKIGISETVDDISIGVEIVKGERKIKGIYRKMVLLPRQSKITIVQGAKVYNKIESLANLRELFSRLKNKEIKIENIVSKNFLIRISKFKEKFEPYKKLVDSQYVLPDKYLDWNMDILFFGEKAFIIDFERKNVIKIKNTELFSAIYSIVLIAKDFGKRAI